MGPCGAGGSPAEPALRVREAYWRAAGGCASVSRKPVPTEEALDIAGFARRRVASRLEELRRQVQAALGRREEKAVHDLRVAIRRFSEALKVFRPLLPETEAKRVRKKLRKIMDAAAEVRDRDIALQFCKKAGLSGKGKLRRRLERDRAKAEKRLARRIRKLHDAGWLEEWRDRLELGRAPRS